MDIIQRYVIPNTATPLFLSAAQYAYDRFSSYGYRNSQALYDSMLTLVSLVTAKVFANAFVAKTVGKLENYYATNIISYLTEPLVNYFLYGYLYRTRFKESQIGYVQKTDLNLMLTPIIQSVISIFLDRTIIEWVTGYSGIKAYDY